MISLYSGTPGSGKSLHLADRILWNLKLKRPVICNFKINSDKVKNIEYFTFVDNDDLSVDFLIDYMQHFFENRPIKEGSILLIIDECQILFDCRSWAAADRKKWIQFFAQHRKLGYNIILVSQFDKMIDKQLRSLIEYEYIHRKVSNFGFKGKILSIWTLNRLFVAVQVWYPMKLKCGSEFFLYKKKLGDLYDTFAMFSDGLNKKNKNKQKYIEPDLPEE